MTLHITTNAHRIAIRGELDRDEFRRPLATMHNLTVRSGYQELLLDFAECSYVAPTAMAAIVAEAMRLRTSGVDTAVVLPSDVKLRHLFMNANWAHFLEPAKFQESTFKGFVNVPLTQFAASTEQGSVVNRLVDSLLKASTSLTRDNFAAIEWTLNEITDNVLVHSQSPVGGFVHLTNFVDRRRVEIIVADPGLSIPRTLRQGFPALRTDSDALEQAIREGVTRDPRVGQGNGLYGSYRIAESSGGYFYIHSGTAFLEASKGYLKIWTEPIPYTGTLVVSGMDYSDPRVLADALQFRGQRFTPTDYIETRYELSNDGVLPFSLDHECSTFGSRDAGAPVRRKLLNLYRMGRGVTAIDVKLTDVPLMSSSYADEVFGKLFIELGPMEFMRGIRISGANPTIQQLINRAILQRSRAPDEHDS